MKTKTWLLSLVAVGLLFGIIAGHLMSQFNTANLGNGWYSNLPPVSTDQLTWAIDCLVANGAPAGPALEAGETTHLTGDLALEPTKIVWRRGGWLLYTDAVQTYYHPQVAYVDIARELGLPMKYITCPKSSPTLLVSVASPLGDLWPEKCANCFRSNLADKFTPGQSFADASGKYFKRAGGWFFSVSSWWEKQ